ncbi:DsbA family protein (plasmid) [Ensifer adhaerens]|uniref:2-hydroxychromene-2-carboxylate isomerase n=1 Tax=Ensifer adhaerens TaxID=106592 RepID=UPI001CBE87C9|nr:DsbA family protein [Ensifer adhaerens]MBZ7927377.1 DsbA family protein [Ensifer adhaerens]UAX97812.1 DsbA family protein [Ensifer adhaerens]UAY05191.1 DsbA family protein [Ensifer adhaerens]UAY12569.1 DsbA family protein [Ensifer adhaerens]
MTTTIDYFFSIGSPWSHIGFGSLVDLATRHGAKIRPYLTTIVEENGGIFSRKRPDARRAYGARDLKRWANVRGKSLLLENRPALGDPTSASLIVIAAFLDGEDWIGLTSALQHAFWAEARDIGSPDVREAIARTAGLDGAALVRREADEDVKAKWADDRNHAVASGVFGFPTYRYDGELYWGQDNLFFLERHLGGDRP